LASPREKVRNLTRAAEVARIIGSLLVAAGIIFLLLNFYKNFSRVSAAQSLEELGNILYSILIGPLLAVLLGVAFQELSLTLKRRAKRLEDEFREELLGLIEVYSRIRLEDLAARVGASPREVESLLARYFREGIFKGAIGEDGYVYSSRENVIPTSLVTVVPGPVGDDVERGGGGTVVVESPKAPSEHGIQEAESGEDNVHKEIMRELEELERAYREGLISKDAYEKAKRELESRIEKRQ